MRSVVIAILALGLISCGGTDESEPATAPEISGTQAAAPVDQGNVSMTRKLSGTLYYNFAAPLKAPAAMAIDLRTGRYRVVSSGVSAAVSGGTFAFIDFCSPLALRLAVTDEDGFTNPISDCVEREIAGPDLQAPSISPDGKLVAVTNHKLMPPPIEGDWEHNLGLREYSATQVYDLNGRIVAQFDGYGPAAWTKDGKLILGGLGGEAGFGIYAADKSLKSVERIDDGRIKDNIWAIDAHPTKNRIAFIFNGQLFDMSLSDGKPKRLHQHGQLLAGLAYSPNGNQIAIVSNDTLDEAIDMGGRGYPIFIYENGKLDNIRFPFVISGPLDWTK